MKFEIIENEGLELIGIVKKIEMKKGAEEKAAYRRLHGISSWNSFNLY